MVKNRVLFITLCTVIAVAGALLTTSFLLGWIGGTPEEPAPTTSSSPTPASPSESESPKPTPSASPSLTPSPSPTSAPKTDAQVFIVYSAWNTSSQAIEVSGFISNVIESDGTCSVKAVKGDQTVTAHGPAMQDATTTSCGTVEVPGSSLSNGDYTVTLSYTSGKSEGESESVVVKVTK